MAYDKRGHAYSLTLEQVLFRYIADLQQTGDDDEASYLVHLGSVETAKSIDQLMARLGKNLSTLSERLCGLDGMDRLFHDVLSAMQRCRLKYRSHMTEMLDRKRMVQCERAEAVYS